MPARSTADESEAFEKLKTFITDQMRMSHIYQPVMLMELLRKGGSASVEDIASAISAHDPSQIEYYAQVTKNMVGRVLAAHRIVERKRDGRRVTAFRLNDIEDLLETQVSKLIALCEEKLHAYVEARGQRIWEHRRTSAVALSGTVKYEVLKRAKFRCELCGVSADERALEVDHIVPRRHGGSDDITNLQALCYSCNAMKRNRDQTDFRAIVRSYAERQSRWPRCGRIWSVSTTRRCPRLTSEDSDICEGFDAAYLRVVAQLVE